MNNDGEMNNGEMNGDEVMGGIYSCVMGVPSSTADDVSLTSRSLDLR